MGKKKSEKFPETQHSRKYNRGEKVNNPFVVLDSPDDRTTVQNGDGLTLIDNDNPDDLEK